MHLHVDWEKVDQEGIWSSQKLGLLIKNSHGVVTDLQTGEESK